jgi:hypothetical protein
MDIIEHLGIESVPVIAVIVFLIVQAVKATPLEDKWLPVIAGAVGGVLGLTATFLMPDYPAHDPLTAIAVGIVSGLAATGAHQIYKKVLAANNNDRNYESEAKHLMQELKDSSWDGKL